MARTRRDLLEKELERLKSEGHSLARDWRRLPFLAATVVLVLPAYLAWGPAAGLFGLLCVPCLIATGMYLVAVRRNENHALIEQTREQIEQMRQRSSVKSDSPPPGLDDAA